MPRETRETEVPLFVPTGFPDYLAYRPEADTIELHSEIVRQLAAFDKKLETSNHVTAHQLGTQHLNPLMQLMYRWVASAMRDQLVHTHHLAEYTAEDHPDFLDEEDVERFDRFFDAVQGLVGLLKPFVAGGAGGIATLQAEAEKLGPDGFDKLLELVAAKSRVIEENIEHLADTVAAYAAPVEEDEDEEEGDEDAEGGEGEEEGEDEDRDPGELFEG